MSTHDTPETLAAVDLGSNSFHMIVARLQNGQLQILDRLREPVRLAAGLTDSLQLEPAAAQRALACLERFGQRIRELHPDKVRAVGTNTLRRARTAGDFLDQAQTALGHPIEVISGIEEARLIYLGVAHSLPDPGGRRLVVDIGGGSTELIIGEGYQPVRLESLYMGCVSLSRGFFADGAISKNAMREAILAARLELQPVKQAFSELGWSQASGSSGTVRAIRDIVLERGWSDNGITAEALKRLRSELAEAGHVDRLAFKNLSDERRAVLPGGVAILSAVFHALKIKRMLHSSGALREGLLYDLIGRMHHEDVREQTVQALIQRHHVDATQAARVEKRALMLLEQAAEPWQLRLADARQWLHWAAQAHEIGLVIAHSQYHKHGAYLIEYSDMPGFSQRDQHLLATLIRLHRRKIQASVVQSLPVPLRHIALYLVVLLRLAVLLHRDRADHELSGLKLECEENLIRLRFPDGWLEAHPLTRADLDREKKYLKAAAIKLRYE